MALDPTQIAANGVLTPQAITAQNQKLQAGQLANTGAQQGIDAEKIKQASAKLDYSLQTLAQVHDQASFDAWHMNMQKNGVDTAGDPTVYDPKWQEQSLIHGVSMKDQMTIAATAAYRKNSLALKAAGTFGSVEEAAKYGYRRADDGVNWEPLDSSRPAMLGGNSPAPQPPTQTGEIPANATDMAMSLPGAASPASLPQGAMPNGSPMSASDVANTPAGQDPLEAFKQARAAQGVSSPATRPEDVAALQQQPAAQVAASPVQRPYGETQASRRLRFQQQGGTQDAMIHSRMSATGEDYATAASAIKNGIGQGNTVDANGNVVPRAGSLSAATAQAGAKAYGVSEGKEAVEVTKQINDDADHALATKRLAAEMGALAQNFTPGNLAPMKEKLGSWAISMGADPDEVNDKLGNIGDMQAMGKLTAQLATQSMKAFTSRGTQMEFASFLKNNPNIALTPQGFQTVLSFLDKTADIPLKKQQAFQEWSKDKSPTEYQKFSSEWDQKALKDIPNTLATSGPAKKAQLPTHDDIDAEMKRRGLQ